MNYGNCVGCKKDIKYHDVPLCEDCRNKVVSRLNECVQNGAKTIKDMTLASGLSERLVKGLVLNGYVSVNQESKEIKEEEQENVYKKLTMLNELKQSIGAKPEVSEDTNTIKPSMHFIGRRK